MIVEARYTPKSVTFRPENGGFYVKIAGPGLKASFLAGLALLFAFAFAPALAFVVGFFGFLVLFFGGLAAAYFLMKQGTPPMYISAEGVTIAGKTYRYEDISGFVDSADDSWVSQAFNFANVNFLGIQYGIYAVRTPYILTNVESNKVAPFLNKLLQATSPDFGKERERKTQQAEVF